MESPTRSGGRLPALVKAAPDVMGEVLRIMAAIYGMD